MSSTNQEPQSGELSGERLKSIREFGIVLSIFFLVIGGIALWKGKPSSVFYLSLALPFLIGGFLTPNLLSPVEKGWMWLAEKISWVMTRVILTLTHFLVITPLGILLRIIGKDLLSMRLKPQSESYWEDVEIVEDRSRHFLPY